MDGFFEIINSDCIEAMREMDENSIDSIVTDPPYGLSFMGKGWDHAVPGVEYWTEALRVLKPGGHLVAFGGTRLYHRLTCAIEDAGFEVRDCLMWIYGSGFPKSHDVSKAIDKAAGHWRGKAGEVTSDNGSMSAPNYERTEKGDPITPDAIKWQGWGTALKPAWEPIILARKPFKGTVAGNVLEHGTGALNIDGCRVDTDETIAAHHGTGGGHGHTTGKWNDVYKSGDSNPRNTQNKGRWPANLVHDGSDDATRGFHNNEDRYFYCAKASQKERNAGLDALPTDQATGGGGMNNPEAGRIYGSMHTPAKNSHPTVKPIALMAWLCRMITPPDGTVLDPFAGSGSTIVAAIREGFKGIGIEMDEKFADIARRRCDYEEW
jgi:site-specific DNA-methyltransferase (adenine-specific)